MRAGESRQPKRKDFPVSACEIVKTNTLINAFYRVTTGHTKIKSRSGNYSRFSCEIIPVCAWSHILVENEDVL